MAQNMGTFFTFAACRIVMAQLEGSGRGSLGAYDASGYEDLAFMLHNEPMKDGDVWLLKLMQKNYNVGVRVLDVRKAYCLEDFEFDQCERLSKTLMAAANTSLLRKFAVDTLESRMQPDETL